VKADDMKETDKSGKILFDIHKVERVDNLPIVSETKKSNTMGII
jgi:hypothetical protein